MAKKIQHIKLQNDFLDIFFYPQKLAFFKFVKKKLSNNIKITILIYKI